MKLLEWKLWEWKQIRILNPPNPHQNIRKLLGNCCKLLNPCHSTKWLTSAEPPSTWMEITSLLPLIISTIYNPIVATITTTKVIISTPFYLFFIQLPNLRWLFPSAGTDFFSTNVASARSHRQFCLSVHNYGYKLSNFTVNISKISASIDYSFSVS